MIKKEVFATDGKELIDKALALPVDLTDGTRNFHVVSWAPSIEVGGVVKATIEVIIMVEKL